MERSLAIGIVGGMSPESTVTYYQRIVHRHQAEFHNHNYPRIIIVSVSFQQYVGGQHEGAWTHIARGLESRGVSNNQGLHEGVLKACDWVGKKARSA